MSHVSVIVPNYNREALIGETISNLLAQTLPPYEIIVVDDGSTDKSVEVIRSFGDKVQLIQQANQGPGAARNAGLKVATGDYIQFQDSDDLMSLNKLQTQTQLLDRTGADIAFSPWAHVYINDRQLKFETCVLQQSLPPSKISLPCWLLRGWFTVFQSLLFRRSFLAGAGDYATDIHYGEDMDFFFRLISRSPRVAFTADALTLYRVNSVNNLSSDGGTSQNRRVVDWACCLQRIFCHQQKIAKDIDATSRAIFLAGMRKHLRYLRALPNAPTDLVHDLATEVAQLPGWFLGSCETWIRVAERLRLVRTGQRWRPCLQAGPPTESQRQLIAELGFGIS